MNSHPESLTITIILLSIFEKGFVESWLLFSLSFISDEQNNYLKYVAHSEQGWFSCHFSLLPHTSCFKLNLLIESTEIDFINILRTNFLYESALRSFSLIYFFWLCNYGKALRSIFVQKICAKKR